MALTETCVVEQDTAVAIARFAQRFIALDEDILRSRWEQGGIVSELRETHGDGAVKELGQRVGYGKTHLTKLADFFDEFDSVDGLDPSVPIGYYIEASREFTRLRTDPKLADLVDDRPEAWAVRATAENWSTRAMVASIRAKYGLNGINAIVGAVEDPRSTIHQYLDGEYIVIPHTQEWRDARDTMQSLGRSIGEMRDEHVIDELVEPLVPALQDQARAALTTVRDRVAELDKREAQKRETAFAKAYKSQLPTTGENQLLTFRVNAMSDADPDAVARTIKGALQLAGCTAVTVTHLRRPQARRDEPHVVA
jgi:hypothetical protein